jgi:Fic family protein
MENIKIDTKQKNKETLEESSKLLNMSEMLNYKILSTLQSKHVELKPNSELAFFLARKDKTDFIYNTSALEGNPMTYPEVETLLEGITVGGHKLSDEQQVLNQNKSVKVLFEMIKNNVFKIDYETVCKLHEKVANEEALSWGEFRKSGVNIGGTDYKPPRADDLKEIFDNGIQELEKQKDIITKAISYFLFGAINQFFYDGNKRTSRLMMNGVLLSNGYPILNIKAKDKLEFNTKMIEFYNSKDMQPILDYLISYYIEQNKDNGFI